MTSSAWRQLIKRKIATTAAVLSLALAIGACTSAFRLIDALFLRPLPVTHADRLYALARQRPDDFGVIRTFDDFAYPNFTRMRAAAKGQAELIATSFTYRTLDCLPYHGHILTIFYDRDGTRYHRGRSMHGL